MKTELFFVVDPTGTVWKETAKLDHDECRNAFVRMWFGDWKVHIDHHTCWNVWICFTNAKWKIESVEVPIKKNNLK